MILNDEKLKLYTEDGKYICTLGELLKAVTDEIFKPFHSEEAKKNLTKMIDEEFHKWCKTYLRNKKN